MNREHLKPFRRRRRILAPLLSAIVLCMTACGLSPIPSSDQAVSESALPTGQSVSGLDSFASYNPISHGADPTGTEDSTPAITACIEANKGGRIVFSPGTYLVSEPIKTPHLAKDRVSIDFNGAIIKPSKAMDFVLDIGGLGSETTSDAGVIRTYYENAVLQNVNGFATTGIKVEPLYKDATFDDCNIISFRHGAEISAPGTGKASDTQFTNCFLKYTDVSDVDSYGVGYFGSDNKMSDCRIYGFHYSIYLQGGGLFASNVHNLPKGLTENYAQDLEGSAFLYADAGFVLSECYCDTYETFVDVRRSNIQAELYGCRMYSYKDPMRMQLVKFSHEGNFTGQILLDGIQSTPRKHPLEGEKNTSVVFSSEDDKVQLFRSGLIVRDCTLIGSLAQLSENLHGLDVLTTPTNNNPLPSYTRGITVPASSWVPLCAFLLTPEKPSTIAFGLTHYVDPIASTDVHMAITKDAEHNLSVASAAVDPTFPLQLGYSQSYDAAQGFVAFVVWCRSVDEPYRALTSLDDIRCDNAFPVDVWNSPRGHYHNYYEQYLDTSYMDTNAVVVLGGEAE